MRRTGEVTSWKAAKGTAAVWNDDSFEPYLSNVPASRHLPGKERFYPGVSAEAVGVARAVDNTAAWRQVL